MTKMLLLAKSVLVAGAYIQNGNNLQPMDHLPIFSKLADDLKGSLSIVKFPFNILPDWQITEGLSHYETSIMFETHLKFTDDSIIPIKFHHGKSNWHFAREDKLQLTYQSSAEGKIKVVTFDLDKTQSEVSGGHVFRCKSSDLYKNPSSYGEFVYIELEYDPKEAIQNPNAIPLGLIGRYLADAIDGEPGEIQTLGEFFLTSQVEFIVPTLHDEL